MEVGVQATTDWIAQMDAKGPDGAARLQSAKNLIAKKDRSRAALMAKSSMNFARLCLLACRLTAQQYLSGPFHCWTE